MISGSVSIFEVCFNEKQDYILQSSISIPRHEPVVLKWWIWEGFNFPSNTVSDPSIVRHVLKNDRRTSHDDAMRIFMNELSERMDKDLDMYLLDMPFVTSSGREAEEIQVMQEHHFPIVVLNIVIVIILISFINSAWTFTSSAFP